MWGGAWWTPLAHGLPALVPELYKAISRLNADYQFGNIFVEFPLTVNAFQLCYVCWSNTNISKNWVDPPSASPWYIRHANFVISMTADDLALNPVRAKLFRGNITMQLHFMSFRHIDMTPVIEIFLRVRKELTYFT